MTKGGVVISELSPAFRKAIERSIGVALEDPEKFVRVLKKAEIELTDEAIMALLLGFIFNLASSVGRSRRGAGRNAWRNVSD
ncbi:hypothetical protein AKJ65_05835 [candidate division MSBL1 archaeon SCGC-AAA259E19]|uniref:Uncharacterized protein n=1 Tax=candidate division MSBL1 archaeon SCGC-AAA259E19 TaxID=1698264 RepID=A0A133UI91_9EURY|nr:hypothetical protein AKJ65_05835 [candidate division MSBL1 archaeon SCGC-AAA259E19]